MIYLDHTATTRPYDAVAEIFHRDLQTQFFNPAGLYRPAVEQEASIRKSLSQIAATLGCSADELVVTSGATESINTAVKGYLEAHRRRGGALVITAGDHPATQASADWAEQNGTAVVRIPLNPDGTADRTALEAALEQHPVMVSMLSVNNETGAVNDIGALAALRDRLSPETALHIDHVQAWQRLPLNLKASGIELASFSGHKVHGPKGIGLLYAKKGVRWLPWLNGGGQQGGRRSGTEYPTAVKALAAAAAIGHQNRAANFDRVRELRRFFLKALTDRGVLYTVHAADTAVPHILSIGFEGMRAETLLHVLEASEIYLSAGSACSSRKSGMSRVLKAMGVPPAVGEGTLRVSLDASNTEAELNTVADCLRDGIQCLNRTGARRRSPGSRK